MEGQDGSRELIASVAEAECNREKRLSYIFPKSDCKLEFELFARKSHAVNRYICNVTNIL